MQQPTYDLKKFEPFLENLKTAAPSKDTLVNFNTNFNKGNVSEADAQKMLEEINKFINGNETKKNARVHKDEIIVIIAKLESKIKNKTEVFDIRPLFYDAPSNSSTKWREEHLSLNNQKFPIFNLPDTSLSLSAGTTNEK